MSQHIDFQREPFSLLEEAQREMLLAALQACRFAVGRTLLRAGQPSDRLLLICSGVVAASDSAQDTETLFAHYGAGDLIGVYAVIAGQARHDYRAEQDCECLALPAKVFLKLIESNNRFAAFFLDSLSVKQRLLETRSGGDDLAELTSTRIPLDLIEQPLLMPPETGLRDAARRMVEAGRDCFLIAGPNGHGIMTRTDLIHAWAVKNLPDDAPVGELARFELVTLDSQAFIFNALVAMTEHRIARVLVTEGSELLGILEMDRILAHLSSHSHMIGVRIEHAKRIVDLQRAASSTSRLVRTLVGRGIKLPYLMDLMTALNDRVIARMFELLIPKEIQANCCLLTLVSEGLGEQILKTDQDNALIIAQGFEHPQLAALCDQFTEELLGLGYPRCPGNIMVSNSQWRGDREQWRKRLQRWCDSGDEEGFMNLAIFSDARAIAGNASLFDASLADPVAEVRGKDQFFHHFAGPALRFSSPLTLFGGLRQNRGIDLKKSGTFPIVHGVRCMALQQGINERNTFQRIRALQQSGRLDKALGDDLASAFEVLSTMRVRVELANRSDTPDNQIDPRKLDAMERDLLRDALRVVKQFKDMLTRAFHLEI